MLWHILTKPFLYCLYFLGRIVDTLLCTIVLAIVATVNQISFEAFIIVVGLCLDVLRATPRLREPAAQFVANHPLLQKSLNPQLPHYLAYAIVGGMSAAYIILPDICLPELTNFIQSHFGIVARKFQKSPVCDVSHGTILAVSSMVYACAVLILIVFILLVDTINEKSSYEYYVRSFVKKHGKLPEDFKKVRKYQWGLGATGLFVLFMPFYLLGQSLPFVGSGGRYNPHLDLFSFLAFGGISFCPLVYVRFAAGGRFSLKNLVGDEF